MQQRFFFCYVDLTWFFYFHHSLPGEHKYGFLFYLWLILIIVSNTRIKEKHKCSKDIFFSAT